MPLEAYKVIHLVGVFLILLPLGGICLHMANGGTREYPNRKFAAILHGIGLLIAIVGGFGMLARLGMMQSLPAWVIAKLVIWLILGGVPALIYRQPGFAKGFLLLIALLATTAAGLAIYATGA